MRQAIHRRARADGFHAAEAVAGPLDGVGKLLDLVVMEALLIRATVEDLQGRDLVFVGLDELHE